MSLRLDPSAITISTHGLGGPDSFDFWWECTKSTYRLAAPRRGRRSMRMHAKMWRSGGVIASDFACESNQKWRDRKLIEQDARGYLKFRRYLTGDATVVSDGEYVRLRPGATYAIDQSRPVMELSRGNHQLNVFVPHEAVGYDPSRKDVVLAFGDGTALGVVLASAFDRLFGALHNPAMGDAETAIADFCASARLAVVQPDRWSDDGALRRARRRAVADIFEHELRDPFITVDEVVERIPASRATVYRCFQDVGGIATYIRRRRLHRALLDLAEPSAGPGAVGAVSDRLGYSSPFAFSKAFKRELGLPPDEVVGMLGRDPAEECGVTGSDAVAAVHSCFDSIRAA